MKLPEQQNTGTAGSNQHQKPLVVAALLASTLLTASQARAQNFAVNQHTIDGGGGKSSGGSFSLTGTVGQPDANAQPMTGGNFSLTGGFWSLVAVQTEEGPTLEIHVTSPTTAALTWPAPSTGYVLQESGDMSAANWTPVPGTVHDSGTVKTVIVNILMNRRFYRLAKP